jgi:hypothetical protein
VEQLRASWNLLLSWLREVQAWGQGAEAPSGRAASQGVRRVTVGK